VDFLYFVVPILFLVVAENNLLSLSRSSTKAKYKALGNAIDELIWVEALVRELGVTLMGNPCL
jgi:hypothetical protein